MREQAEGRTYCIAAGKQRGRRSARRVAGQCLNHSFRAQSRLHACARNQPDRRTELEGKPQGQHLSAGQPAAQPASGSRQRLQQPRTELEGGQEPGGGEDVERGLIQDVEHDVEGVPARGSQRAVRVVGRPGKAEQLPFVAYSPTCHPAARPTQPSISHHMRSPEEHIGGDLERVAAAGWLSCCRRHHWCAARRRQHHNHWALRRLPCCPPPLLLQQGRLQGGQGWQSRIRSVAHGQWLSMQHSKR